MLACSGCSSGSSSSTPPPPTTYALTVDSTNPSSGVSIAVSPADVNGSATGSTAFTRTYDAATAVTLTAPSASGTSSFSSWTGCTSTTGTTCTIAMNAAETVTATYTLPVTLTVNSTNPASGVSIAVSPTDLNGASNGSTAFNRLYAAGSAVTLTAPATSGAGPTLADFTSWSGCTTATTLTCNVTLAASTTVTANYTPVPTFTLTVNSTNPATGVAMTASPADVNGKTSGSSPLTLTYDTGTAVAVSAPATIGNTATFSSWTGCGSVTGATCNVALTANATVSAAYTTNLVSITPNPATAIIGQNLQFSASVTDPATKNQAVTWSIAGPASWTGGVGTITNASRTVAANGLYTTPYPAPPTVTVTATSVGDPSASASVTVALTAPAAGTGPALSVDTGNRTHAIDPLIYGMNNYQLTPATVKSAGITIDRFGGDGSQRYNYQIDATSSAGDYYFENQTGATGVEATGAVNAQIASDKAAGAKTIVTVDVLGWIAKDTKSCSFPTTTYPNQYAVDPYRACGDGEYQNQSNIVGNDPTVTSIATAPSFTNTWVKYLTNKFGSSASGGVFIYELDNEPAWWDAVHRDVHPVASTYDEVTNNGIAVAQAVKSADPTVAVSGPVIDYWWNYFYSKKDIESGWGSGGPCFEPWSNPVDRKAHGGVPMVEYYLQQMQSASTTYGARLLDYLDLHTYDAATYQGNSVAFTTAGDTGEQQARLNSTRAFWDPTYTDPNLPQPNYVTDTNYTANCATPLQAPQVIPMMKGWVAKDYPGTKTAITEYNWGGQESIDGALAQADILGIFGREGLDLGTLWGPPDPVKQVPGLVAFEAFRNYDGAGSQFGDMALASTSTDQGLLSVYGAQRTSDGAITVIVLNKTYGDLSSTLSLPNLTATGPAKVYLYNNANIAGIVAQPSVTLTPPGGGTTVNTLTSTFPAQSITILVIPTQ